MNNPKCCILGCKNKDILSVCKTCKFYFCLDHDNLIKVIGAIDKENTIKKLTKIKDEYWDTLPDKDYLGMASIWENAPIKNANLQYIEEIEVGCVTFEFLMEQLNITEVDYLKIDTEGLDYDILNSIDFNHI